MTPRELIGRLDIVREYGDHWTARCPAHDDRANSLSIATGDDGRILVNCFAGCDAEAIVSALGLRLTDLFPNGSRERRPSIPQRNAATLQHPDVTPAGCTLAAYSEAKRLPLDFLRQTCQLSEISYQGAPAVRMPYLQRDGTASPTRFRVRLDKSLVGDERFRWKAGHKPTLYGLWRLELARERGYIVAVEGESDCHTLWHHGEPAIGLPGAGTWKDDRDAGHLDDIPIIYVVIEPDAGGEGVKRWLAASRVHDRVRLILPDG